MALRSDPYGNIFCSECGGKVEYDWSIGKLFSFIVVGDIITWVLAGVFALFGMLWEPAYILALCVAAYALYRGSLNQKNYTCTSCKREFTHKEVLG